MKHSSARVALALLLGACLLSLPARGYVLNRTIAANGGCPQLNRFDTSNPAVKKIDRRWSTSPSTGILTSAGTWGLGNLTAQRDEVRISIQRSFDVWAGVAGTTLQPQSYGTLVETATQNACSFQDGLNSLCFNQTDSAFTGGVLAFTRVVTSDIVGEHYPQPSSPKFSAFVGEVLDTDIYFKPNDPSFCFATPAALTSQQCSNGLQPFDLESVLIHELGHFLGFSHSAVWRAMMWPFAPSRGQFTGDRPTAQAPDGPLSDDDRTGLRVLYPDAADTTNVGIIRGRVVPANPIALFNRPGETGIFGTHVVAVDADSGLVVAGTLGGWSCDPGNLPTRFDGTYVLERLPVGRSYKVYVEPLDGPTTSGNISGALSELCRSNTNNSCTVPAVNTNFTTRVKP